MLVKQWDPDQSDSESEPEDSDVVDSEDDFMEAKPTPEPKKAQKKTITSKRGSKADSEDDIQEEKPSPKKVAASKKNKTADEVSVGRNVIPDS